MKCARRLSITQVAYMMLWLCAVSICPVRAQPDPPVSGRYFVTTDGVRLHYLEAGSGRTLVFVPGWAMPAQIWEPQIAFFSRRFHVVALDPRSQGDSDIARTGHNATRRSQDIHELIAAVGAKSVTLVAWSLGVLESLAYLHFFGDANIDALILVDNSVGEDPPPAPESIFLERLRSNRAATVAAFVKAMYKTPQPEPYLQRITRLALKTPLEASIELLSYNYPRTFWRQMVHATRKPILYAVTPHFGEQAANLKRARPDVTVAVFEDAGHALFVDEAARFNKLVDRFLRERLPR